jgi:hypothetical protein
VLKRREEFAVSLRKKKHSEIITSKRRSNMQKVFERTLKQYTVINEKMQASGGREVVEGDNGAMLEINDVYVLSQVI